MSSNSKGSYIKLRYVSSELWLSKFHKGSISSVFNGMSQVFLGSGSSFYSSSSVNFEICKRTSYVKSWKAYFNMFANGSNFSVFSKELLESNKMNPLTSVSMDFLASEYEKSMECMAEDSSLLPEIMKFHSSLKGSLKEYSMGNSSLYEGSNIFNDDEKWSSSFVGGWSLTYSKSIFGGLLSGNNYYKIPSYLVDRSKWVEEKNKKFYSECIKYGSLPASYNSSLFSYLKEESSSTDPYSQVILESELSKVSISKSKASIVYLGGKGLKSKCSSIFSSLHSSGSFLTPLSLLFDYLGSKGLEEVNKKDLEKEESFDIPNSDAGKLGKKEVQNPLSYLGDSKMNKHIWKNALMKLFYKKVKALKKSTIPEKPKNTSSSKKKSNLLV